MKTYLFRFQTNYEEAGIIITTDKGLEYAKQYALELRQRNVYHAVRRY